MIDEELSPVLIDFDLRAPEAETLAETGTAGWTKDGWSISSKYNDRHGLDCLELHLCGDNDPMDHV